MSQYFYEKLPGARLKIGRHGRLKQTLGFYDMMPGARLEVGPHGELEETLGHVKDLGACCSSCANGAGGCGTRALGADSIFPVAPLLTREITTIKGQPQDTSTSSLPLYLAVAAVGIVGAVLLLRRRRR